MLRGVTVAALVWLASGSSREPPCACGAEPAGAAARVESAALSLDGWLGAAREAPPRRSDPRALPVLVGACCGLGHRLLRLIKGATVALRHRQGVRVNWDRCGGGDGGDGDGGVWGALFADAADVAEAPPADLGASGRPAGGAARCLAVESKRRGRG